MGVNLLRRGDIYLVNFAPARENETNYTRPAIIVTNNTSNAENVVITVVPLTSNIKRIYDFQLLMPNQRTGLNADSKAQVEQIRSVAVSRVLRRLGHVPADLMSELDARIRLHLAL